MATTAVTSTTSTTPAAVTPYSAKTAANKLITSLGSGSGVDTNALAQSLSEAEVAPQKSIVNDKITKAQSRISGYSAIKYVVGNLQAAFKDLMNKSSFVSSSATSNQPEAVSITSSQSTDTSNHTIVVTELAKADIKISQGFSSKTTSLNVEPFTLFLNFPGRTPIPDAPPIPITPTSPLTPQGIVDAINLANTGANATGVSAQFVNTGESANPFKIVVKGATGAENRFTFSGDPDLLGFVSKQSARNGDVTFDGIPLEPTQNTLTDLIPGTTVNLWAKTTGTGSNIGLTRDTTSVKTKMQALVTAYNEAKTMLDTVSNPASTVDTYGATLVGNSLVSTVRSQIREMFLPSTINSNANGIPPTSLRDLGVSIDKTGTMSLDNTKLDSVLASNYDDVAFLMTKGKNRTWTEISNPLDAEAGVAAAAFINLSKIVSSTGSLSTQTANQTSSIANFKKDLLKLDGRMTKILARYTQQLSKMDSIVGQTKAMQTSLTNTFAGMSAMYTNK